MVGRKASILRKDTKKMGDSDSIIITPVRKRRLTDASETSSKRRKGVVHHSSHATKPGIALAMGEGDTGQLGLGEDIMDRGRPTRIPKLFSKSVNSPPPPATLVLEGGEGSTVTSPSPRMNGESQPKAVEEVPTTLQVCAGGMHSVCLSASGDVFTFGCNDEDGLGRPTAEEGSETHPGIVIFPEKLHVIQVSAGDSHTSAITAEGDAYVWGTFRDSNGVIGLTKAQEKSLVPKRILTDHSVIKVTSGTDHVALLTTEGELFSLGCAEQGQLGRVAERFVIRGGRKGMDLLLTPSVCRLKGRVRFDDVWAGSYVTFARCAITGGIYACGLNNYFQLGLRGMESRYMLSLCSAFKASQGWSAFAFGQHHTLAIDGKGCIHSLGRSEYGRLGLGPDARETDTPTPIPALQDKKIEYISCGTACSFAIDSEGIVYSWGMGSSRQLGHSEEDDCDEPKRMLGKNLENKFATMISGGGQHVLLLVHEANSSTTAAT